MREITYYWAAIHEVNWLYNPASGLEHLSVKPRELHHSYMKKNKKIRI